MARLVYGDLSFGPNEEKTLRDFVTTYKDVIENLDNIQPDIDELGRLQRLMSAASFN
jgi:hypothetical protein